MNPCHQVCQFYGCTLSNSSLTWENLNSAIRGLIFSGSPVCDVNLSTVSTCMYALLTQTSSKQEVLFCLISFVHLNHTQFINIANKLRAIHLLSFKYVQNIKIEYVLKRIIHYNLDDF